jgi:hypothetical protein
MIRPVLRPSSGMSVQKYYEGRYNKNLRGPLFAVAVFHNVETWNVKYEILKYKT